MAQTFDAQLRRLQNQVIIDMSGEINAFAENALKEAYAQAESENPAMILLNFGGVSYINSTGIALIVGLMAQARVSKRRLGVFGLSNHYMEIFQITRLVDYMDVFPDQESALTGVIR
jgi:anti-anti-sigma factor